MKNCSALSWALLLLYFHAWLSSTLALERALVEVVIYEHSSGGDYTTYTYELEGSFSNAGTATSAEGDILEVHPLGLCNTSEDGDLYEYGWVGVVRLTPPDALNKPCFTLFEKVRRAIQRGATAIIFDISDYPDAAKELNAANTKIARPVVLINGKDAKKLTNIIKNQKVSRARIQYSVAGYTPQRASNEYFDMVIFMTFFILVSIVCFILLLKIKWRQKQKESSLTRMALHALSRMETRKYHSETMESSSSSEENRNLSDAESTLSTQLESTNAKCVICLEKFKNGQDVRIVPCQHEFHKECVDPWLLSNYTCPLCMLNIVEREGITNKPRRTRHWFSRRCGRCLTSTGSVRSSVSSVGQYTPEIPSQTYSSNQFVSSESENNDNNTRSSVVDLSSQSMQRCQVDDSKSLQEQRTNCENDYVSLSSLRSTNFEGTTSPYEDRKCYTHQLVVVAPITKDMMDVSQEDIV
ncbi:E3 ubiquitin-protein ligase ZNRF3-like [Acropora muricata]|uniref:E3 ubiquitin-protein ligase ZNRF3-like n=1 Tax=Acropora muricata TaxID=159855 RepID=UPI0010FC8A72|nr:E3 ubiquitin-protein ligase ZNRF3-like isoform X2 [Acropora millepora]